MSETVVTLGREDYPVGIQRLFFDRYSCAVPSIALRSLHSLRMRGVYAVTDDDDYNAALHHHEVDTSLTINQIFEVWRAGYEPQIANPTKTLDIFNAVVDHLAQWVEYLSHGIQMDNPPFEDLLQLDQFADKIYVYAAHERMTRNLSYFSSSFGSSLGFNLSPTNQLPLLPHQGRGIGGNHINEYHDPRQLAKMPRHQYTEDLTKLGGRLSQEMRVNERAQLFSRDKKE